MTTEQPAPGQGGNGGRLPAWVLPAYGILLAYGTLFPISGWRLPEPLQWRSLLLAWPESVSSTDLLTNVLIYIPLGALVMWRRRSRTVPSILVATLLGAGLSYGLECIQIMLPRVPSRLDLLANAVGTLAGAVGGALTAEGSVIGGRLRTLRRRTFVPGRVANVGLFSLGLWVLSQWAPLVPSADWDNLKAGIRPLWDGLHGTSDFDPGQAMGYAASVLGLALLASTLTRSRRVATGICLLTIPLVLAAKVPIITRQLSLEAVAGSGAALVALPFVFSMRRRRAAAGVLVVLAVLIAGLRPEAGSTAGAEWVPMSWIPFATYRLNLFDFIVLSGGLWPFVALAYLSRRLFGNGRRAAVAMVGGLFVMLATLAVEWAQRSLPGRVPDITDVLLATAAWFAAWGLMSGPDAKLRDLDQADLNHE